MMNYKVLLADDEEQILRSIRKNIDWKSYGMEVVETFLNGRDVLEFLGTEEADILITDIRMPYMDGLELAENIRQQYPQMKVIIISGYDDFNYAKKAMSCQVSEYILKPVNAKEMGCVLEKVRDMLDRELEQKKNLQLLKDQYRENLPVIRENLLNRIVMGTVNRDSLEKEMRNSGITIGACVCWTVALLQIDRIESQEFSGGDIGEPYASVYLQNLIRDRFDRWEHYEVFYSRLGECVIFGMKDPEQIGRILLRLNGIVRESMRVMGIYPTIGVGKIKYDLMEVKTSFEEAREALLCRRMGGDGEVIYMEDVDISGESLLLFDEESREMLFSSCKFGECEDVLHVIEILRNSLESRKPSRGACQAWAVSILNALLIFSQQYPAVAEDVFDGNPDCLKILNQYGDIESFFGWLEKKCLSIRAYFAGEREKKANDSVAIAREYMQKEYGNQEISLEKVAMEVGLTPSYFSALFKKETGEVFVEYLTRLRMEEAIRLLEKTDDKIYMIAEKTGYPDAGYFSHLFKKKYGISPVQYRRQKSRDGG